MKKYLSLLKLLLIQQYRAKPTENSKKKRGGTVALIIVLGICFLPMLIGIAIFAYTLGQVCGMDLSVLTLLITVCQGLVLIFGTMSLISNVFNNKDADRLLCLPISPVTVFLAKFTVVYISEAITTAATILFLLVPFGVGAGASAGFYLTLPFVLVLLPILPLLVGCLLAMPFSALISKISKNSVVRTVLQVLFFVVFFAAYVLIFTALQSEGGGAEFGSTEEMITAMLAQLQLLGQKFNVLHCNAMLSAALIASSFGNYLVALVVSVAENAALLAVVALVSWPFYKWILSSSLETTGAKRRKAKGEQLVVSNRGVVKELVVCDLKRTLRNSQLGFQSFAGLIMMPLMIVIFYFAFNAGEGDGYDLLGVLQGNLIYQVVAPLVIVAYMSMLGIGSNVLGMYPISRENNSLYLLKTLPVDFSKILLSKVILSTALMLVVDFLTILLSVLLFGLQWYFGIAMLVSMLLLGFGGMCITTLVDLKSPKLGWTNFNQSLKNAKNAWIAMLVGFIIFIALAALSAGFIVWFVGTASIWAIVLMWIVLLAACFVFAALSYKAMNAKAHGYFARIEP